ncbi:MAG: AlbA family DNA-binding domain-containing protein [Bacteroidota bacterium]
MNYSENYLGKSLTDLQYTDIETFFGEEQEETNRLEFKSYSVAHSNFNENIEGVIRGICAFLNSDGGLLIWGAPEGIKIVGRQEKVFLGELSPVPELKEKDWLINKISDSITPLPVGINIHTLEKNGSYVYVFEIQKSKYSPHQFKNTYFARLDGQNKPAPHYLIEALFKKITFPRIEGFIKPDKIFRDETNYYLDLTIFLFNFSELQNEEDVSFRLVCPQGIFTKSQIHQYQNMYSYGGHQLIHKELIKVLHFGWPNIHTERLKFIPDDLLDNHQNKVELLLSFGGKYSPLKSSDYKLNFANIDWNNQDDPNYLIVELNENILLSELQRKLNKTREDTLKSLLKR